MIDVARIKLRNEKERCGQVLERSHVHSHCIIVFVKVLTASTCSRSSAASFAPPPETVTKTVTNYARTATDRITITSL